MIQIIPAEPHHAPRVVKRLRDSERLADFGEDAEEMALIAIRESKFSWLCEVNGEPAALFGLVAPSLVSDEVFLWMMVTKAANRYPIALARKSWQFLDDLSGAFQRIIVMHDPRMKAARRWLRWLGFRTSHTGEINGVPVVYMVLETDNGTG